MDPLAGAAWELVGAPAGTPADDVDWTAATSGPGGPVAARLGAEATDDALDWCYRVRFSGGGRRRLSLPGVATLWTAWVDGEVVAAGDSMFRGGVADLDLSPGEHELRLRCASVAAAEVPRKPRAAWRSQLLDARMRWIRTAALGRIPWPGSAPVIGPWRPVTLGPVPAVEIRALATEVDGDTGRLRLTLAGRGTVGVRLGEEEIERDLDGETTVELRVHGVRRWWPHGYGEAALYPLTVRAGETVIERAVGFRTVSADVADGGFTLRVNGQAVFARGACWVPVDPLDQGGSPAADERALRRLRDGGANLVRITGTGTYLPPHFHCLCSELGLMVWHDVMLHTLAPPDDDVWLAGLAAEVGEQLTALQGWPSTVVVSGGSETEQQPVLWGLAPERWSVRALTETVPGAVEAALPDVVAVASTPTGGWRPTAVGAGIAHYFGVGGYRRPLADARACGVRFAAECLAFGVPPGLATMRRHFGADVRGAGWARGVAKDPQADWNFEDVLEHYANELFGPASKPRPLPVLRAAAAEVFARTGAEWRRPGSACAGAIVLSARDLLPGAGWGLIDADGEPKASWFGLARVWRPRALVLTDEGLDSLALHVVNDEPLPWAGRLTVTTSGASGVVDRVETDVEVPGRSARTRWVEELLGGFRDLNHAWAFGPPAYDAVTVELGDAVACTLMPDALRGAATASDPGLTVTLDESGEALTIAAARTAPFVVVDAEGWTPSDQFFHLGAGTSRTLRLRPDAPDAGPPRGVVSTLGGDGVRFG